MTSSRGSSQLRDQPASLRSPTLAGRFVTTSTTLGRLGIVITYWVTTYYGDYIYTPVSIGTPKTNAMLYANYISIKN